MPDELKEKEIVVNFIKAFFKKDSNWKEVSQFVHSDATFDNPLLGASTISELYRKFRLYFSTAFPDTLHAVETVAIAENGRIFVKAICTGTFVGNFMNIKANQQQWKVPVFWEFEVLEGKIKFASEVFDHQAMNQQLKVSVFKAPFERGFNDAKEPASMSMSQSTSCSSLSSTTSFSSPLSSSYSHLSSAFPMQREDIETLQTEPTKQQNLSVNSMPT